MLLCRFENILDKVGPESIVSGAQGFSLYGLSHSQHPAKLRVVRRAAGVPAVRVGLFCLMTLSA